ncbi:hypothetical protein O3G_MSEX002675 [Manduca sexta]|uniref:Rho GTPase-activating protein 15 n=1 Tax=Manduca sexta TaxID=7130 RepID=A0A921YP45_MANSE|nr:hypothetical protein O3G_MSEX002675 [Manduca sexta]
MSCEVASWIPNAVAATLRAERSAPCVVEWLTLLRASIEEYDPLVTVRPPSPDEESCGRDTPDSAFDEILSQLGKEIFKLDEYQRNLVPAEKEVSLSILNIFDECLEHMTDTPRDTRQDAGDECSDCESTLSDVSFVTSTPARSVRVTSDINNIFDKGDGTPVPPRRTKLKTPSTSSSIYDNMEVSGDVCVQVAQRRESDSDSASTCWSYKECSVDAEPEKEPYAAVWSHSTGFHNSDEILRRVLSQHHATISRLSFDTASDFETARYSVYAMHEVGDRCADGPVAAMTPDRPTDDGYELVRDAITDENIYEEIDYGCSYTDEGCSCGTSVEVESCSISASSEGVDRDSPLYANLRDHDAYAIPADVIYWKNLLLDPFYNDDEEDEWITPEECAVYTREQRPPLVIPRITQYNRVPRRLQIAQPYLEENIKEGASMKSSVQQYERLQNWSPTSERSRADIERSFNKANSDSPPFPRIDKRLGGSTENLLLANVNRSNRLQIPASSSGDSLDVEIRDRELPYARSRKSRSMVAPKHRMRSPIPAPRHQLITEAPVIKEGLVKRTKYFDGNKKSKKNWTDCYMVLTTTRLHFYKDQRTYQSTKGAELTLTLNNARVLQCGPMHTRRHTRSLVLNVGFDQYLIQDETEEGARTWFQAIWNVIYALYPNMGDSLMQQQSSNTDLESLGRTPPSARHAYRNKQKAGGSSNEDLSESTEGSVQKSHVRTRLKKFFAKRPAIEMLVKKGIYKDEPVFGRNLDEVCPATSPRVPEFVVECVREIESSEENMCTDGLYRASGNLSQVQKIRLEIDQNNLSVIKNNNDIHVLTGSLKLFFRELKEPLIPYAIFDRVLAACSIKPRDAKIKEFRDIVQALPLCNRDTLKFLLEHLLRVTKYSERNRMHTANLAIVFGPTLLWAPPELAHNIAVDCIQQNNVVDILLNDFHDIFDDKNKKKA